MIKRKNLCKNLLPYWVNKKGDGERGERERERNSFLKGYACSLNEFKYKLEYVCVYVRT